MGNQRIIFCDFDGTITKEDTVNKFLKLYADSTWLDIEDLWLKGDIGSKECLVRQFELVDNISEEKIQNFVNSIQIDDYFIDFYKNIRSKNIPLYIVSDGVEYFIKAILAKYGINDLTVFSNSIAFDYEKGKIVSEFPNYSHSCKKQSGLCKCSVVKKYGQSAQIIYIGDGASDICVSDKADLLFAKKTLAAYCDENNISYIKFENFKDINSYLLEEKVNDRHTINV